MKCPICNKVMSATLRSASETIAGRKWVYEYEEMVCSAHPNDTFQTEAQVEKNVEAITKNRRAALILQKHTQKGKK